MTNEEELAAWNVQVNIELDVKRAEHAAAGLVDVSYYPGRCVALFGLVEVRVWYVEKAVAVASSTIRLTIASNEPKDEVLFMAAQHLIAAAMFITRVEKAFVKHG